MKSSHYSRRSERALIWSVVYLLAAFTAAPWVYTCWMDGRLIPSAMCCGSTIAGLIVSITQLREAIRCHTIHESLYAIPKRKIQ